MNPNNYQILIIHPYDTTTVSLNRIGNYLKRKFPALVYFYEIKPNKKSHLQCIELIKSHPNQGLIIFMGHGRTDGLYGAKGKYANKLYCEEAFLDDPDKTYNHHLFITSKNAHIFKDKKLFCLACNSSSFGSILIDAGCKSYIGFGELPSSVDEFVDINKIPINHHLVADYKGTLNYIIKKSIERSIVNSYTFKELYELIRFVLSQHIASYLIDNKKNRHRYIVSDALYYTKKEIVILGNSQNKIIEQTMKNY